MEVVYLDINCFQRSFDDFSQSRIKEEAEACQQIFKQAESLQIKLVWSFMHQDETDLCPWSDRKLEVFRLSHLCQIRIPPADLIQQKSLFFQKQEAGLSVKDAIHLAASCYAQANYFLTCDKRFLNQAKRLRVEPHILNPVEYVQRT